MNADEPKIADLIMIIAKLVQEVRRHDSDSGVAWTAMNYLKERDCTPAILRDLTPTVSASEAESVLMWVEDDDWLDDEDDLMIGDEFND